MTVELGEAAKKVDVGELEKKYTITDRPLFYKCVFILGTVISLFFLNSFVDTHLSLAWIALIGTMSLLVLANVKDINVVLEKVRVLFFYERPGRQLKPIERASMCRSSLARCCSLPVSLY